MYLRWTRYKSQDGTVRLYGRLVGCSRVNGKPRQHQVGRFHFTINPEKLSLDDARAVWWLVDHDLSLFDPTPTERARIEQALIEKGIPRPEPDPLDQAFSDMFKQAISRVENGEDEE